MAEQLQPERPAAEGQEAPYPDEENQEGVHLLANQAFAELEGEGFTREQVFEWAAAFNEEEGGGTVEDLVAFIRRREQD